MPRGPRRGASSERRIKRKVEKTLLATHGGFAGASLIETLETELLEAVIVYLQIKDYMRPGYVPVSDIKKGQARGIVSGLTKAVAVMRNTYTADDPQVIKAIEREFVKLARIELSTE